jgi:hypothetical protein
MSILKTDNFKVNGVLQEITRSYDLWVWRPGPVENEFGVVSP